MLGSKLETAWNQELNDTRNKNKDPSLMKAGLKVFGYELILMGMALLAIEMLFKVTSPILLGGIVRYYANSYSEENAYEAYLYAAGLILCSFLNVIFAHGLMLANLSLGMKLRVSACSLIYRKSLRLSKNAIINTTSGQVVNLLSNDVSRFELIAMFCHYLWVGPLETIVVGILMYLEIGWSSIAGIIFLLLFIPFQCKCALFYRNYLSKLCNANLYSLPWKENISIALKDSAENRRESTLDERGKYGNICTIAFHITIRFFQIDHSRHTSNKNVCVGKTVWQSDISSPPARNQSYKICFLD